MKTVFVRNWFKYNPSVINELDSKNGIEPDSRARKYKLFKIENGRDYSKEYNKNKRRKIKT